MAAYSFSPASGSAYEFTSDYTFKSASAAMGVVSGTMATAAANWRAAGGKTLGQWQSEQAPQSSDSVSD